MTLADLNAKIDALPLYPNDWPGGCQGEFLDRIEAMHLRDTRLGILGVHAGMEPTEEQVDLINLELFGPPVPKPPQEAAQA